MELKEVIKMVKDAAELHLNNIDSNMVLDCATRIYNSQNIEAEKKSFKTADNFPKKLSNKPTTKMIYALEKIGVTDEEIESMTFEEASKIIGESKNKGKK